MSNNLICFLTVNPSQHFYNFVKQLPKPENIYICIDDNDHIIPNYDNEIKIIKVRSKICKNEGYFGTVLGFRKRAVSRDKALYYFCKNNIDFDNIWFIEEDVFIPSIKTIANIDEKYPIADLLSSPYKITEKKRRDWHWKIINNQIKLNPPYAYSMICAIRCSKKLIQCIGAYAEKHKSLFIDEALFNTIALQNNLNVLAINELVSILYRKNWGMHEIKKTNLYHPFKNIPLQKKYRKKLKIV